MALVKEELLGKVGKEYFYKFCDLKPLEIG
jgi:hypothetical protein